MQQTSACGRAALKTFALPMKQHGRPWRFESGQEGNGPSTQHFQIKRQTSWKIFAEENNSGRSACSLISTPLTLAATASWLQQPSVNECNSKLIMALQTHRVSWRKSKAMKLDQISPSTAFSWCRRVFCCPWIQNFEITMQQYKNINTNSGSNWIARLRISFV